METLDLQGASRISGGLFRGKALGNALNAADIDQAILAPDSVTVPGIVSVYHAPNGVQHAPNPPASQGGFNVKVNFTLNPKVLCNILVARQSIGEGMKFIF